MGEFDEGNGGYESAMDVSADVSADVSEDVPSDISSDDFLDFDREDSADTLSEDYTDTSIEKYAEEDYAEEEVPTESALESTDEGSNDEHVPLEGMSNQEKADFISELRNGRNRNLDDYAEEDDNSNDNSSETDEDDNNNHEDCYGHGGDAMETYDSYASYPESHFTETDDRYMDEQVEATDATNERARRELSEFHRQQDEAAEADEEQAEQEAQEQSELEAIEDEAQEVANKTDARLANAETDAEKDVLREENNEAHRRLDKAIYNSGRHYRGR